MTGEGAGGIAVSAVEEDDADVGEDDAVMRRRLDGDLRARCSDPGGNCGMGVGMDSFVARR